MTLCLEPRLPRHPPLALALVAAAVALASGVVGSPRAVGIPPAASLVENLVADDECAAAAGAQASHDEQACALQALQRRGVAAAARSGLGVGQAGGRSGPILRAASELEEAEAEALQREVAARLGEGDEVRALAGGFRSVCVRGDELPQALREAAQNVSQGLPPWRAREVPSRVSDVAIAFLIQTAWKQQLPIVRRVFDRLYSPKDLFLYLVDKAYMQPDIVVGILPKPLPKNVLVQPSVHAAYFMWPRVEVVLLGLFALLQHDHKWDFAIHLSESDYPVHGLSWIRQTLAAQRTTNFVQMYPRCHLGTSEYPVERDSWYWWGQSDSVASCAGALTAGAMKGVAFPLEEVENHGLRFARGTEWVALTRELVKYALGPELLPFRKLVGMHLGSDEIFWQTLVLNIPGFEQNVSDRGWFIQWGHGKTLHSPDTLTDKSKDAILRSRGHLFFMRKVAAESVTLLDGIDELGDPPLSAKFESPGPDWLKSAIACPKGVGVGNSIKTCRSRVVCGCPPFQDPRCNTLSVMKHPYCRQSESHCAVCQGVWC